ncbi:MAG: SGNH/GDSL hydrolase family protein [Parvibaculaceae bacterium]
MSLHAAVLIVAASFGLQIMVAVPAAAQDAETLKIVTLGTSLTAKGGWQGALRRSLGACRNKTVSVVNLARSGMTSEWGVTQVEKVLAERPDIVLVEFAVNDAALTRFVSFRRSSANMVEIISGLLAGKTSPAVYVMAMNPVSGLRGMIRPWLDDYVALHAAIARKLGAGFIDHRPAWARLSPEEIDRAIPDGTHPDPEVASRVMVPVLVHALAGGNCSAAKTERGY